MMNRRNVKMIGILLLVCIAVLCMLKLDSKADPKYSSICSTDIGFTAMVVNSSIQGTVNDFTCKVAYKDNDTGKIVETDEFHYKFIGNNLEYKVNDSKFVKLDLGKKDPEVAIKVFKFCRFFILNNGLN